MEQGERGLTWRGGQIREWGVQNRVKKTNFQVMAKSDFSHQKPEKSRVRCQKKFKKQIEYIKIHYSSWFLLHDDFLFFCFFIVVSDVRV